MINWYHINGSFVVETIIDTCQQKGTERDKEIRERNPLNDIRGCKTAQY